MSDHAAHGERPLPFCGLQTPPEGERTPRGCSAVELPLRPLSHEDLRDLVADRDDVRRVYVPADGAPTFAPPDIAANAGILVDPDPDADLLSRFTVETVDGDGGSYTYCHPGEYHGEPFVSSPAGGGGSPEWWAIPLDGDGDGGKYDREELR